MKIGFDIGGTISRYPEKMKELMTILKKGGAQVCVITDIPYDQACQLCLDNEIPVLASQIHSCNWSEHQDLCKTLKCEELKVDFLIDDRPDYCAVGDFIGLVLAPRPKTRPYYSDSWIDGDKQ
jgi:hypothetical protein